MPHWVVRMEIDDRHHWSSTFRAGMHEGVSTYFLKRSPCICFNGDIWDRSLLKSDLCKRWIFLKLMGLMFPLKSINTLVKVVGVFNGFLWNVFGIVYTVSSIKDPIFMKGLAKSSIIALLPVDYLIDKHNAYLENVIHKGESYSVFRRGIPTIFYTLVPFC